MFHIILRPRRIANIVDDIFYCIIFLNLDTFDFHLMCPNVSD